MKAISLWEPWASLIRTGAKTIETRSWKTHYRGELLICAAKGGLSKSELIFQLGLWNFQGGLAPLKGFPIDLKFKTWPGVDVDDLHFGHAVAVVCLYDCKRTDDITLEEIKNEGQFGDFNLGRYAWKLKLVNGSFKPFPVRGSQGFFNVDVPNHLIK